MSINIAIIHNENNHNINTHNENNHNENTHNENNHNVNTHNKNNHNVNNHNVNTHNENNHNENNHNDEVCRICFETIQDLDEKIIPCNCKDGVHINCLITWIGYKHSVECEICKHEYKVGNEVFKKYMEKYNENIDINSYEDNHEIARINYENLVNQNYERFINQIVEHEQETDYRTRCNIVICILVVYIIIMITII